MGRAFEYRKAAKMARWGHMSRVFPKLGKLITIAAKEGGPDPDMNPKLRQAIQNAKAENMPKDNIDAAIKRATDKDATNLVEITYEGKGPFGIQCMVECATDNTTRTVANVKSYFNKCGGTFLPIGSLEFMFTRKAVFEIEMPAGMEKDDLELELIDYGVDEVFEDTEVTKDGEEYKVVVIYGDYTSYGNIQKYIEDNGYELVSGGFERIPTVELKDVTPEQRATLDKLTGLLEDDEDVTNVYTTLKPSEE